MVAPSWHAPFLASFDEATISNPYVTRELDVLSTPTTENVESELSQKDHEELSVDQGRITKLQLVGRIIPAGQFDFDKFDTLSLGSGGSSLKHAVGMHKRCVSDLTDMWNRRKSSRSGIEDDNTTISTATHQYGLSKKESKALRESAAPIPWRQTRRCSFPPVSLAASAMPHSVESIAAEKPEPAVEQPVSECADVPSGLSEETDEMKEDGTEIEDPNCLTPVIIILMDVPNHQYDLLQLQIDWSQSTVRDMIDCIKSTVENYRDKDEDESSLHTNTKQAGECGLFSESRDNDDDFIVYSERDTALGSPKQELELDCATLRPTGGNDQFFSTDYRHESYHSTMSHRSKCGRRWSVRYDGLIQCRSLPETNPIMMINCFGLRRYDVTSHEIFVAKPTQLSAKDTSTHAELLIKQLVEKGMIHQDIPGKFDSNKSRGVLTTLSREAKTRLVLLGPETTEKNGENQPRFLTFSPPYDPPTSSSLQLTDSFLRDGYHVQLPWPTSTTTDEILTIEKDIPPPPPSAPPSPQTSFSPPFPPSPPSPSMTILDCPPQTQPFSSLSRIVSMDEDVEDIEVCAVDDKTNVGVFDYESDSDSAAQEIFQEDLSGGTPLLRSLKLQPGSFDAVILSSSTNDQCLSPTIDSSQSTNAINPPIAPYPKIKRKHTDSKVHRLRPFSSIAKKMSPKSLHNLIVGGNETFKSRTSPWNESRLNYSKFDRLADDDKKLSVRIKDAPVPTMRKGWESLE